MHDLYPVSNLTIQQTHVCLLYIGVYVVREREWEREKEREKEREERETAIL